MLTQSVVAVAVLSGSFALFLITFRHGIVSLLFGDAYAPGVRLITFLAVAMVLLAVVNVLVYFQLARRSRALWFLVPALAMEAVGIHLFHESLVGVACVLIATAAALLLCGSLAAKRFFWTRNGPDTDELRKAPAATR
jgi:O-antigen/teichoic acid export membrane protein